MRVPGYAQVVGAVLRKDLQSELRSKETIATMALFGIVLAFVFAFGFVADPVSNRRIMPGALWSALLFTGALGVGRTFAREAEDAAFSAVVLSPASRSAVLVAKIIVNVVMNSGVMLLVAPLLVIMLHVGLEAHAGIIALQLFLGVVGFSVVGTPLAVIAVNARFPEVLLPMVVFPLVTPVLIAGVAGTGIVLGVTIGDDPWPWIYFTAGFAVTFGAAGLFLFEWMVTE